MGISRFMTLVRKLTNQSCFLFCSYNVNRPLSCLSCSHPRPTNCTDSVLDSLFVSPIFFFFYLFLAAFIYLGLSPCSDPSCLVRGWMYSTFLARQEKAILYHCHIWRKVFSPKGKLACNYNVLAAPNILHKIYSILFLTFMSL